MRVPHRIALVAFVALLASACESPGVVPTAPTERGALLNAPSKEGDDGDATRIPIYTIEDLGIPAGMLSSVAVNVNNRGDVIGDFRGPRPAPGSYRVNHSFIYTDAMHDLGLLPGTFFSNAFGVNEHREVVGQMFTTPVARSFSVLAFLWTPEDGIIALPSLPHGETYTIATGINDKGDIVGCTYLDDGFSPQRMVRWRGKKHVIEDLGTGPDDGGACASAVNERGEISVTIHTDVGNLQAARYDDGYRVIGAPAGTANSVASSINARGDLVGVGFNNFAVNNTVAFLWTRHDGIRAIPLLPGNASSGLAGINNHSLVVGGNLTTRSSTCMHPWAWTPGQAAPTPLPTLTGFHPEADCTFGLSTIIGNVNDSGVIVGKSAAADGSVRAVRWMPVPEDHDKN